MAEQLADPVQTRWGALDQPEVVLGQVQVAPRRRCGCVSTTAPGQRIFEVEDGCPRTQAVEDAADLLPLAVSDGGPDGLVEAGRAVIFEHAQTRWPGEVEEPTGAAERVHGASNLCLELRRGAGVRGLAA